MSEINTPLPRRPRHRRHRSGIGAWLGRLVLLTLGVAGVVFYLEVREVGFESAANNLHTFFVGKEETPEPIYNPLTGGRVVDAVDADTRPIHEQDPRWLAAIALGEEGAKQREDALYEHFEGEGDPFILRSQSGEAFDKLTKALVDLRAMREEYAYSKYSRMQLDFQIERFAKIVDNMHEKNSRF